MTKLEYFVVDAFTTTIFKGNSASVVLLEPSSPLPDTTLRSIAAEFNLAETAFVTPIDAINGSFSLRWFTPTIEFPLCGHATLATASVLFSTRRLPEAVKDVEFETLSGQLMARILPDSRIELELPAGDTTAVQDELNKSRVTQVVLQAFVFTHVKIVFMGGGEGVSFGKYLLVELGEIDLEHARIDPSPLVELSSEYQVIIFTHRSHDGSSTFVSRVFCPGEPISEDPVTGSAHCMLGPYWATLLKIDSSQEMRGKQLSTRSGEVGVIWERERGICRLRGHAKLFAKGELYLPE